MTNNVYCQRLSQKELNRLAQKTRDKFDVPAVFAAVVNSEGVSIYSLQGVRSTDSGAPVEINDYFHIGSCSKSILAVLAGKLVEQNKIRWDSRLFDIFPELKAEALPDYYEITLEDLFVCQAGILPFTTGAEKFPDIPAAGDRRLSYVKWLLKQPPASKKTADNKYEHLYSNAGYTMIAVMLEKVTGQSWEQMIEQALTTDMGLSALKGWPNSRDENQPSGHAAFMSHPRIDNYKTLKTIRAFPPDDPYKLNELIAPAGDLSMRPLEFAKYVQGHLQGLRGMDNYISSGAYQAIHFKHKGFSLGVGNFTLEGKAGSGFDGSAGTFYCRAFFFPEDDIALTIMINSGSKKAVDWLTIKIIKRYFGWRWKFWMETILL